MARISKTVKYLSEAEVIAVNEEMVSKYGGLHGVRNLNLLKSALTCPRTTIGFQDAYKSIFDKAASLFHSLINNHPFLDGNKRTALFSAMLLFEYNDWRAAFKRKEAVKFILKTLNDKLSVGQISDWLIEHSVKARK